MRRHRDGYNIQTRLKTYAQLEMKMSFEPSRLHSVVPTRVRYVFEVEKSSL